MANVVKNLSSGAEIELGMGTFSESLTLMKAVAKELENVPLQFGTESKGLSFSAIFAKGFGEETINTLKNVLVRLLYSPNVEAALWPCLGRCTYNKVRIVKDSQDLEKMETFRGDYLVVAKEVMEMNLTPFFKSLDFLSLVAAVKDSKPQG